MANINDIHRKSKQTTVFDFYNLIITKLSLEFNSNTDRIVPDEFNMDLSKISDVSKFVEYFDKFLLQTQDTSFVLMAINNFCLDLMLGHHPNETHSKLKKKVKRKEIYDISLISLHLGNYSFNFELHQMNNFIIVFNRLIDTNLLMHTSEFRPFLKPITKKDEENLRKALGKKYSPEDEAALKSIKGLILRDYCRLLVYTTLYKKYGYLQSIDVKRRIIWKFKKSSLIYQLIMGKTLKDILAEQDNFLKNEFKYIEKRNAIDLNDKLIYEELLNIQPGDGGLDLYLKNLRPIESKMGEYHFQIRISTSMTMSLFDIAGKETKALRELEVNLTNMAFTLVKPKGQLNMDINLLFENLEVRFIEDLKANRKFQFCDSTIHELILDKE